MLVSHQAVPLTFYDKIALMLRLSLGFTTMVFRPTE